MIFYFSATGNCRYVAERIAAATGDQTCSITDCLKTEQPVFSFDHKERIGIISPTYDFGLPIIVREFLEKLTLTTASGHPYCYFVATYGTTPGQTGRFAEDLLKNKGLSFAAKFSVKMPDTWTPIFDLSDPEKVAAINEAAEPQIDAIIRTVKARMIGDFMQRKIPLPVAQLVYDAMYDFTRKTCHFTVQDSCIGCGLCAKNCPASAIELQNSEPVWVKERCVMCLACLHHCPKFAIQYGRNTEKHGQYTHPPYKPAASADE